MQIQMARDALVKRLAAVVSVVERKQQQPILGHVLLQAEKGLRVTATDLEVEISTVAEDVNVVAEGAITVPGRKLFEIARALPSTAEVSLTAEGERLVVKSKSSRFTLATLPARDFPNIQTEAWGEEVRWEGRELQRVVEKTRFCMAQQDARYFLNGLLMEWAPQRARWVATDGHRLAMAEKPASGGGGEMRSMIVPRKGVVELARLAGDTEGEVVMSVSQNHLRARAHETVLVTKLIDGRYPDYEKVVPVASGPVARIDRMALKDSLGRVGILVSEKYRGVRVSLTADRVMVSAHNPEREEAQEEIEAQYQGPPVEIGFNVAYLLEAVGALEGDEVELFVADGNSSALLRSEGSQDLWYVIMPMRL